MPRNNPYCTDANWPGRADCKHCAIRETVLFSVLSDTELESALLEVDNAWLDAGQTLFSQDEISKYVYTLRQGCVKLVHDFEDGGVRIVRLHFRGDAIGLEALLGEPCRHSAVVLQKADLCRIPVDVIQKLKLGNPRLYQELMRRWQGCLDVADTFITQLNTGQAEARLARLLLKFEAYGEDRCIPNLPREDIAAIIGVTIETASRLMAGFRRRGLIIEAKNCGTRCDVDRLKSLL